MKATESARALSNILPQALNTPKRNTKANKPSSKSAALFQCWFESGLLSLSVFAFLADRTDLCAKALFLGFGLWGNRAFSTFANQKPYGRNYCNGD